MFESFRRRDGGLVIRKDDDTSSQILVEPVFGGFVPARNKLHCSCGAPLEPWSVRHTAADTAELICQRCHHVLGVLELGVKIYW